MTLSLSLSHFCRILAYSTRWRFRSMTVPSLPARWRTVFTQGISVLSNRNALPHCVLSPDCLFGKQRESVDGNRYRMVLRFHSNNNHLVSPSLPLFRASANDARMRRLPSIKIRRVNIINRDDPKALRILPETGYIPNPSRPAFNADSTDNVYRRSSSRLLSRIDLKITIFDYGNGALISMIFRRSNVSYKNTFRKK